MSSHRHERNHEHQERSWGSRHGWKLIVVVALMLGAMATYILTLDDSVVPTTAPSQRW